jgi:hypothetical protein
MSMLETWSSYIFREPHSFISQYPAPLPIHLVSLGTCAVGGAVDDAVFFHALCAPESEGPGGPELV